MRKKDREAHHIDHELREAVKIDQLVADAALNQIVSVNHVDKAIADSILEKIMSQTPPHKRFVKNAVMPEVKPCSDFDRSCYEWDGEYRTRGLGWQQCDCCHEKHLVIGAGESFICRTCHAKRR